jgi:hypothetical protein
LAQPYLEDAAKAAELSSNHGLIATWYLHHAENDRVIPDYKNAAMHFEFAYDYCKQHDDYKTCRMILREIKSLVDEINNSKNAKKLRGEVKTLLNKLEEINSLPRTNNLQATELIQTLTVPVLEQKK